MCTQHILSLEFSCSEQVNLFQKHSFLNHLIHNMTTDCSLIFDFITRKIHVQNMLCTKIDFLFLFWHSEQFIYTTCSELGIFMHWTCNSMNNILSYCGLVDAKISASEKDLPVHKCITIKIYLRNEFSPLWKGIGGSLISFIFI